MFLFPWQKQRRLRVLAVTWAKVANLSASAEREAICLTSAAVRELSAECGDRDWVAGYTLTSLLAASITPTLLPSGSYFDDYWKLLKWQAQNFVPDGDRRMEQGYHDLAELICNLAGEDWALGAWFQRQLGSDSSGINFNKDSKAIGHYFGDRYYSWFRTVELGFNVQRDEPS